MFPLGLIGYPLSHSLSPWIHQSFFEKVDLSGTYKLYEIEPEIFSVKLSEIKEKVVGFNVTLPYKEKIISYIDKLDETATGSGAVNTVVKKGSDWIGYNTDGIGYIRSLLNDYPTLFNDKQLRVLLIGAGGAARGIFHALLLNGVKNIDITNRTLEHAEQLVEDFSSTTNIYSLDAISKHLEHYDLIIQTTSVGMAPKDQEAIICLDAIKKTAIVSDIVYRPLETNLLKEARKQGAHIHYGHTMLLHQAAYAFEIWTGKTVPLGMMANKLKMKLKGS